MKLQMDQSLAIGFSVLLFFDAVQARICLYCRNVDATNACKHKEQFCKGGRSTYCFTRRVERVGKVRWMHRGCANRCVNTRTRRRLVHMECCKEDHCNHDNLWDLYL